MTDLASIDLDDAAGTRVLAASYTAPWSDEARTIDVNLWYPTDDTSGTPATWLGTFVDGTSLVDASFADPGDCTFPLAVYSHGSQGWAGGGSPLARQLVRNGWVVVGPDHRGNTLSDNLDPRPPTFSRTRTLDVSAAIDAVEALPESDPLYGRVDTSRVLVFGHSYGGQTSWLMGGPTFDDAAVDAWCGACTTAERDAYRGRVDEPRVAAVLPMAGSAGADLVAPAGFEALDVPVFYMTGSADHDGSEPVARAAAADVTWVEIEGGCHETFTSTAIPCSGVEKDEGLTIVGTYVTAFATSAVLGGEDADIAAILDGSTVVSDKVTLSR